MSLKEGDQVQLAEISEGDSRLAMLFGVSSMGSIDVNVTASFGYSRMLAKMATRSR